VKLVAYTEICEYVRFFKKRIFGLQFHQVVIHSILWKKEILLYNQRWRARSLIQCLFWSEIIGQFGGRAVTKSYWWVM
jgi:hypothetical protein